MFAVGGSPTQQGAERRRRGWLLLQLRISLKITILVPDPSASDETDTFNKPKSYGTVGNIREKEVVFYLRDQQVY